MLLISFLLFSCDHPIGYGLLLWSRAGDLVNGQAVVLLSESQLNDTYQVLPLKGEKSQKIETVSRLMVANYSSKKQALRAARNYELVANLYVQNARNSGLYVRDRPSSKGQQVYRLSPQEAAKVIEPPGKTVSVGQYQGKWYRILTQDGNSGYVFDLYLRIYLQQQEGQSIIKDVERAAIVNRYQLEDIGNKTWYLDEQIINLKNGRMYGWEQFSNSYFQLTPDEMKFNYRFAAASAEGSYSNVTNLADSLYQLDEADLIIEIFNLYRINIRGSYRGESFALTLVSISEQQLKQLTEQIKQRDDKQLLQFLQRGLRLNNDSYGGLSLARSGRFSWDRHQKLIAKGLISAGSAATGQIDFPYQPAANLEGYDGVITFTFDISLSELSFLYRWTAAGVRLRIVPLVALSDNNEVDGDYLLYSPTINFNFSGSAYVGQ